MGRAEIGGSFPEPGKLQEVQLAAARRIRFRRHDAGVKAVLRLILDPIVVPPFEPVLLLQRGETFLLEKLRKPLNRRFGEVCRRARSRRAGREGDGIDCGILDERARLRTTRGLQAMPIRRVRTG